MAQILAYTSPATGQLYPIVDTLLELTRRGHDVHVRAQSDAVECLGALGLRSATVDSRIEANELDDWRASTQIDALRRILRWYEEKHQLEIDDMRQAIEEAKPDALIVDIQSEGAAYVAEASGLPWATYCPYPPPFRSVDSPPHGLGFAPARGPLGHMRDRFWHAVGRRLLASHLARRNEVRARLGLPALREFDEQWLQADRFIAFTAEPYEYPRSDWPQSVRLVGPGCWEPPAEAPTWLAGETRPIVLVTASTSYQADERLIATALEAFREGDLALVATTAGVDAAAFTPGPGARVERFLPHGPIIARAACVISHGGQGTTQRALAAGVPVCAVPFCRDQFDVARRVEVADAGVRLHHKRLNPERLRAAVSEAMSKRAGAERVAEAFAGAGGPSAAAGEVEQLLSASERKTPGAAADKLRNRVPAV